MSTMPRLMAVLNASPDSFSGGVVAAGSVEDEARGAVEGGATVLDVGGQSLRTDQPEIAVEEELARTVPVVQACRECTAELPEGVDISVDTYRAAVAEAAIAAGATMVNDPSGLRDRELVDLVASTGVGLVLSYNRSVPKVRIGRHQLVDDPVEDGLAFLSERLDELATAGVRDEQIVIDPGPDLGKSPAQTVEVLRSLHRFRSFGLPLLLALSRKDFIGALTMTAPHDRSAGLFGVLAALRLGPDDLLRVHEPGRIRDFYVLRQAVDGTSAVEPDLVLPDHLRHVSKPA